MIIKPFEEKHIEEAAKLFQNDFMIIKSGISRCKT